MPPPSRGWLDSLWVNTLCYIYKLSLSLLTGVVYKVTYRSNVAINEFRLKSDTKGWSVKNKPFLTNQIGNAFKDNINDKLIWQIISVYAYASMLQRCMPLLAKISRMHYQKKFQEPWQWHVQWVLEHWLDWQWILSGSCNRGQCLMENALKTIYAPSNLSMSGNIAFFILTMKCNCFINFTLVLICLSLFSIFDSPADSFFNLAICKLQFAERDNFILKLILTFLPFKTNTTVNTFFFFLQSLHLSWPSVCCYLHAQAQQIDRLIPIHCPTRWQVVQ